MNRKLFSVTLCVLLALLLSVTVAIAQEPMSPRPAKLSALPAGSEWQQRESHIPTSASTWLTERVDSNKVGNHSSLALNSAGWPHISYYDFTNDDLKYAYKDASGWHIETVDYAGRVGAYTSLALDAAGRPHISYCSRTNDHVITCNDLKYAWRDDTGWHVERFIDSNGPAYVAVIGKVSQQVEWQ